MESKRVRRIRPFTCSGAGAGRAGHPESRSASGGPAIRIHREYLGRQRNFTGYHCWARGYCVSTVGVAEEVIRDYIRKQEADEKKQEKLELG